MSTTTRTITIRRQPWTADDLITVTLTPANPGMTEHPYWEVRTLDGKHIGNIGKYAGSIKVNHPGTRIRRATKTQQFWDALTPDGHRVARLQESRAEAIRNLITKSPPPRETPPPCLSPTPTH